MENINISLGIELDKKQFNDNYIQGQVDKAASNIAVKVNNVKIKDVSKSIQNDLDKQVGNLDVQIKGVSLDESEIKSTVNRISDFIQKSLNSLPKEHMFKFTTDNGMLDVKQLQKEITNGIKNAINESMDLAEIDFDKLSVTGGKKIANSIGDILQAESVASNVKEEVSKINNELDKVSDKKVEIEAEVDDKYREGIESIKRDIESLSSDLSLFGVSDSKSLSEYENKINDIFKRINEIGKLNIDIDFSELEGIYNELDKIRDKIDNEFQKSLQVDKDDELEWLSDNIKSVEDDIQKLEVALSKINLADDISDDDKISELKNKINSLSDELEIFYNEDITKSFNQDINDMILRLEELKTVLDSVNNSKIKEEQMDSSNEKKSKDGLNLEISDVIIIDEEKIVSSLQNSLDSISKRLSILVEHIKLSSDNSDIVDVTNLELSNISGKLNSLEVGVAITDEFKAAILSDIESLFNQVEPILEKLENKFKVTTSKIEQYFGAVITKITNDLSYLLSENIKFDFTKSKLIGLDDKLNSIRDKLTLQVNDIDLGELAYKNEEIQTQLNVFTSEVALEIKNIKLLNVVEEIQTKLDDIGKDLEITVKNVNIDSNKSVSDDNRETNNTSTVIDKPITSKELKSQISKMKEKYNNEVNSLINSFVDENSLKGLKGKIKNAIKSDSLGSSETYDEIVKAAENYIYKYNKNETKKHTNDILKEYNALRDALKGVVFKEADLKGLDKDQLSQFKKSISGIATISKEAGISVDKFMEEFKDVASLSGFDMGGDVLEDNLMRLSEIMSEMKNIKKNGVSAGLTNEEEEEYLSHVTNKYIELIGKVEELKSARNDGISAIQKEFELSQKLAEEQKKSENNIDISSDMNDISEATNKANSELKEYNDELSKITKTSVTFVDNEKKSVSQTTEGLGKTTTSTTKFNVDGSITEIDKIVNNTKAFNKEIDNIRSKIENLNNTDADTIGKISEQLNNFKVGDSIDAFERLKREVEELSKLDKNIDNVRETISKLNEGLRDSKIEGYFDKSVFKEIQESINSITTDSTEEEIKSVSDRIKELGKTKNDIVNINKTIDDLSRSLTKLKNGTGNDKLSLAENSSSVGAMTRNINSLIKMRDKLVSGEFLGSKVEQSIVAANNKMKDLQVTISATTKNINELQKQKGISENVFIKQEDLINKLKKLYSDGFIDDGQFKELQNRINNLNIEHLSKGVFEIKNEFDRLTTSGSNINKLSEYITELERKMDKVAANKFEIIDSNEAVNQLNETISKVKELESLKNRIDNGEDISAIKINETYNNAKNSVQDYKDTLNKLQAEYSTNEKYAKDLSISINNIENNINELANKNIEVIDEDIAVNSLNKILDKLKELESLKDKVSKGEFINKDDITKAQNETDKLVNSYKNLLNELTSNVKKSESQFERVSKVIDELNYKTGKSKNKNSNILNFDVVSNALSEYEKKINELNSIQNKVFNGENISKNVIEKAISDAKREADNYIEVLKLANTHGKKFEDIFNRINTISNDRTSLGLDSNVVNKLSDELFNLPQGADETNKKIAEINNTLSLMENNINKISSLKNILKDVESDISNLTEKKDNGIISESESRKLKEIEIVASNLKNTIESLGNNADIGSVKFEQLSTSAKESIKNISSLGDLQSKLTNKLKELQVEEIIDDGQFKKLQNKINNINTDKLKSEVKSIENEFANLVKNGKQLDNVTKAINKITKDVDNVVSGNIKFIDSDKAISEINSLMSKLNELNIIRDKLSNGELVGNKAINEAISGVKKVADTYTQTLSNLASNQKMFDNISKNLDNATTNKAVLGLDDSYVNKLRDELNNIDLSSNEAQASLKELESTVERIGNSDKDIQKLKGVIQQLEDSISKISDKQKFGIVTESDINKMNEMKSNVNSLNNIIDKLNNGIEVTQIEIRDLEATAKNSMKNISSVAESTSDSFSDLGINLNRAMEFAIGDSISGILEEQVRMAGQTILDIDDKIRDLKRVTKLTAEEYKEFTKSSNEAAISIGRSTAEAIEATTSFVKLGYSVEEAKGYLSEAGLTLANVADMNTEDSIDAITSTLKGFGLEVQEVTRVIDVMNESGNKFALSTSDLAEMLRIGSASMSIAGNDLEQTSALMIGAFEILQDSSKVANGLKTISMRLRGVAEENEELNPKLGELVKTLTGVDLTDVNGEFRNTYEVLSEIGQVFDTLNSKEQALLLEELAGKNQVLKASYVEKSA